MLRTVFGFALTAERAQGMYALALQERNYGATRNAGTIDRWFALCLEHTDFLVTDDRMQYKALRVINV
jgi:hypothetical protein